MKSATEDLSNLDFSQFKSAIDAAAIVAITDKNGIITYVNTKFCEISKYSPEELLGKTHRVINSKLHSREFFEDLWQVISSGNIWEGEIRNRAKDGSYYWVSTTIVPFLDQNNQVEKYISVRYDITERKLFEEQLQIYSKKLAVSNRELQDFASIAAHDLQEPLRKIQTFSERLKTKTNGLLPAEALDYMDRIQNSTKRMHLLINDLLTYSRVTTKAQPFSSLNLNQILSNVVLDLEIRIEQSKGKVNWADLPFLEADPVQMHQLFLNLISNGLKFRKPDEAPIVKIESVILEDSPLNHDSPACQISVHDNGIGFDEKYLDRIFTIFQRLHGRHEYEGTGIGLALCRKIVDRHGGTITAHSQLGGGSTFIVTLPIKQQHRETK